MGETVECPYCEEYTEINTDDFYEGCEEFECNLCGKNFEVEAEPTINYRPRNQADCLNGSDHKWRQIVGCPEIYFKGKYRCEDCTAEKQVEEELATEEEWDKYFDR